MSTINGKLIVPLTDDTERIGKVEKKVNSVVVSLQELIEYSNQENKRIKQTIVKVSDLDNRLQTIESKKRSGTKVLIWLNFMVSIVITASLAGNLLQIHPETINKWQTLIKSLEIEQQ